MSEIPNSPAEPEAGKKKVNTVISIRFPPKEHEEIQAGARAIDLEVSVALRKLATWWANNGFRFPDDERTPPRSAPPPPAIDLGAVLNGLTARFTDALRAELAEALAFVLAVRSYDRPLSVEASRQLVREAYAKGVRRG